MWGTGASSTQCEGAAPASDWWDWERAGHAPPSGDGNGFATRYAEDFALLAGLGLTHHRLSIEWARIEPEPRASTTGGRRALPRRARPPPATRASRRGSASTTSPCPAGSPTAGGFLVGGQPHRPVGPPRRLRGRGVRRPGRRVAAGQRDQLLRPRRLPRRLGWPPGHDDRDEAARADEAIQLATAEAAVRLRQTGAPVSSIFGLSRRRRPGRRPGVRPAGAEALRPQLWAPGLGLFRDGVLRVPGPGAARAPRPRRGLRPDRVLVLRHASACGPGGVAVHPPGRAGSRRSATASGPTASALVLDRLHAEVPGTPLLVAEYGIGTDDDAQRAAYLAPRPRGRPRGHRPGRRRAGLVPLDRRRQLRVAPRLRRALRDRRPRPQRPPQRRRPPPRGPHRLTGGPGANG